MLGSPSKQPLSYDYSGAHQNHIIRTKDALITQKNSKGLKCSASDTSIIQEITKS